MRREAVLILWDSSYIWGLMAYRAMRALGLPCRLVKAIEISQGGALVKRPPGSSVLLVPGGAAGLKARALGARGFENVRRFVAEGGFYLGFCGGAGLALSDGPASLGLCPLRRSRFERRFYHFLSGHVTASRPGAASLSLPIWWPGRFNMESLPFLTVLASYDSPGRDLWLADLPLADVPKGLLTGWAQKRGLSPDLRFPKGSPLAVRGSYGAGEYILSYAHLETPASPDANLWLCGLLEERAGLTPLQKVIPEWRSASEAPAGENAPARLMKAAHDEMRGICAAGLEHGLLFKRKEWLLGWRSGFPGMACNSILAALAFIAENRGEIPGSCFLERFEDLFSRFAGGALEWLWTRRLDSALNAGGGGAETGERRLELFGHPMLGGGLAGELLDLLHDYIWLSQDGPE